jgi:hypothetical protein
MRLNHLLMVQHEVDIFLAQFESLAHEAQYPLDAAPTLSLLASKLPFHMMNHIYKVNRPQTFTDWATSIRQYHQDNTAVQNLHGLHDEGTQKKPAPQQKGFSPQQLAKILGIKMPTPDANAMDTHADINQSWNRNKGTRGVTNLQGPPSERTPEEKLWDFKTRAQQYARDRESCDDTWISYLEFLETEAEDDLALARMIAG